MKALLVILLVSMTTVLASSTKEMTKRELRELDPVTRMQYREQRLRRWCTTCLIQYDMIVDVTGFQTEGHIYTDADESPLDNTGVIIGISIDLGNVTVPYLRELGVTESIIDKLTPYIGLKGVAAHNKKETDPLIMTNDEANELSNLVIDDMVGKVERLYNDAVEKLGDTTKKLFVQLTCQERTVLISLHLCFPDISTRHTYHDLWTDFVAQDMDGVIYNLNILTDYFPLRRKREVDLLQTESKQTCECQGWAKDCNDPHIETFDGRHYDYQGVCSYILFTDGCGKQTATFKVESTTESEGVVNGRDVSKVAALTVRLMGQTNLTVIKLRRHDVTLVNGQLLLKYPTRINPDVFIDKTINNEIRVKVSGKFTVTWDGNSRILTSLADGMFGKVCGLLGDADGDKTNDFRLPNGERAGSVEEFGKSWEVPGSIC